MSTAATQPKLSILKSLLSILTTLLLALLVVGLVLAGTLIVGLGVVLIGKVIAWVTGLTLFEASILALGTAFGLCIVLAIAMRPQHTIVPESDWDEDDYDEDEDLFDEEFDADEFEEEKEKMPVVGRNDPCPCGSGKKYKNCHGK